MDEEMRLLIVGSALPGAIELYYLHYMKNLGVNVELIDIHGIFFKYYHKNTYHKIIFRLGISSIFYKLNSKLLAIVEEMKPTHILVFKGMEVFPSTLMQFKSKGIKLSNYNPDNPYIFSGKGSGNSNISRSISLYDLHFTYSKTIEQRLQKHVDSKVAYLPFGFDIEKKTIENCRLQPEILKACFLGNPDSTRASFLIELGEAGVKLDVYGNNWQKFVQHPNIRAFRSVYGEELWKVLYRYRIQLNIMRVHNLDSHNMRTFEIPAIGGIQVAPDTPEHRTFFQEGKEIFLYKQVGDCAEIIRRLLSLPQSEAEIIRQSARIRCEQAGYSYQYRSKYALNELKKLKNIY